MFGQYRIPFERYSGAPYTIGVIRNSEKSPYVEIEPRVYSGSTTPRYGFNMATEDANFTAVKHSWYISRDYVRLIRMSIVDLFTGAIRQTSCRPRWDYRDAYADCEIKPIRILGIPLRLAINLAVMNLLPIPALDGGRICF